MGWKTGSHYIASLTKTSDIVRSISPSHVTLQIAESNANKWLRKIAPPEVTIKMMINTIRNTAPSRENKNLTTKAQ